MRFTRRKYVLNTLKVTQLAVKHLLFVLVGLALLK